MLSRRAQVACALAVLVTCAAAGRAVAQDSTVAHAPPPPPPVQIHGFLEVYYRAGDPTTRDGYRLRKADLKFSGDLSPELKWRVTFDAAKVLGVNTTMTEIAYKYGAWPLDLRS